MRRVGTTPDERVPVSGAAPRGGDLRTLRLPLPLAVMRENAPAADARNR
jgi:hypothetical protein